MSRGLLAAVVIAGGCELVPHGCTLADCVDGLFIEFDAPPTAPIRIEATVDGQGSPVIVECAEARQCQNGVMFPSFRPEAVHLKVTHGNQSVERDVSPYYVVQKPNGAGCDPTCHMARIPVTLPRA